MSRQRLAIPLLCLFFLVFSLLPTGYELYHRDNLKPERAFELVHNFPTDYNFYLSRIRQGIEGRWTVTEQYTSEPHNGSFIQILYLLMGRLGKWSRVPWERGGDVYHMARIVFGLTLLLMIAEYVKHAFVFTESSSRRMWSIVAFILVVTASTWPKIVAVVDDTVVSASFANIAGWRFGGFMPWWSVMDSLQRITFIPHLLVGQFLIVFLLLSLGDDRVIAKRGNWVFLGLLGFVLGIVFPPGLLFVYVTLLFVTIVSYLTKAQSLTSTSRRAFLTERLLAYGIFIATSVSALLYLQLMVSFYPWKRLAEVDIIRPLPFDYGEYFWAVGPVLPFGLMGLILAVRKRVESLVVSVAWVSSWVFLLIAFHFVPQQSPLRFSEMVPHVPLGVLTAYLLFNGYKKLRGRIHMAVITLAGILIISNIGIMYSSWLWQKDFIDHKIRASYPLVPTNSYVMYPLKDFLAAMKFIQDNTTRDTVILSETTAGNYMPVYSGNIVYVGHDNTVDYEGKRNIVTRFFQGGMSVAEARSWMEQNNLHVVFFGPQERDDGNIGQLEQVYLFLHSIYSNVFVTVYRVD